MYSDKPLYFDNKKPNRYFLVVIKSGMQIETIVEFETLKDLQSKGLLKERIIFETILRTKKELFEK